MAETMLVVGTLCLIGLLNVLVLTALLEMRRAFAPPRREETEAETEAETEGREVYPVKNIGEELTGEEDAENLTALFRMSRYAATPDELIAGILREDQIREKRGE